MGNKYIDDILDSKLHQLNLSLKEPYYMKSDRLIFIAKRNLRLIKQYYQQIMPYETTTGLDRMFSDSYYRLDKMLQDVIKVLKNTYLPCNIKSGIPYFYNYLETSIRSKSFSITTESIASLIDVYEEKQYLKSIEFDFISVFIKLIISEIVVDSIKGKLEDKEVFECSIRAIYDIQSVDMEYIVNTKNRLELLLKRDNSGVYDNQTIKSKQHYRYMITKISMKRKIDELLLTRELMQQAIENPQNNHIGLYIYQEYNKYVKNKIRRKLHFKALYIISALLSFIVTWLLGQWYFCFIVFLPIVEIIRPIVEYFITRKIEYDYAPRMDFDGVVPDEYKTLVVVSTLVPDIKELPSFKMKLEKLMLSNQKGAISYVVLADLKQDKEQFVFSDREKLNGANKVINELNRVYNNNILLVVRKREYSKTQNCYTGKERKRGAITDLISLINGKKIEFQQICGDIKLINDTKYILALDYDTTLLMDSVVEFVQVVAHPINKAVVDHEKGVVVKGYGIIAPKVALEIKDFLTNSFTRIMGGSGGTACYDMACSELYQDLYGEGIFTGKGLIDVYAYNEILEDKFESETVLSHDILEGSFLRTRFIGDIEVVDGMPTSATPYFKRLHRWIRGDFQNSLFLLSNIKKDGKKFKNPLSKLDKYKIFDNLRRAITPLFSMICIFISGFLSSRYSFLFLLIGILTLTMSFLFSLILQIIGGQALVIISKSFSNTMASINQQLAKIFTEFILLPQYAYVGLDGGVRGLYRRLISKKKMLEWTTAAQVQNQSSKLTREILFYMPCIISSIVLLFSKYTFTKKVGAIFLLAIPFVFLSQKKCDYEATTISKEARRELINDLESMLSFYNDFCNKENNFLPPDNIQKAPIFRIAHRTSPTNIGLMLLSMLTARDFDLISSDKLYESIYSTIETVEKLKKFHGNLYNWYDTKTKEVLAPCYVSAVDSGNFVCSLVCLKEGLKEYEIENLNINNLISRIEKIIDETNLSCFYNKKKKLLSIGYESSKNELSNSHYDMLMSEARMTSYFAIAKRQVPKKHWGALGRIQSRQGLHTGPMSWTGTMFEYFMPELLLHCVRGSLAYEGLSYCIECQKKYVEKLGIPYGISESAIYEFDEFLNYQYKANGVQRLALKQGMNEELVISPYSTYLTLSFDFHDAYKNLNKLKRLNITGKYGLYEALDFTKKRIGENVFIPIQSYMAHHIGMSILAINNALNNNILQKRFSRDKDMSRAAELLQEKMRVGNVILSDQIKREKMSKKDIVDSKEEYMGEMFLNSPRVKVLSNDKLTSVLTDLGAGHLQVNKTDITRRTTDLLRDALGVFCFLKNEDDIMSLTYAPSYQDKYEYEVSTTKGSINYYAKSELFKTKIEVTLHRTLACEQRVISVTNTRNEDVYTSIIVYLEPVLFPFLDDAVHKAFSKLFINVRYDKKNKVAVATRKKRSNEEIMHMAIGFKEDVDVLLETNRENIFENGDVNSIKYNAFIDDYEISSGVPDPCIALRIPIELKPNQTKSFTLLTTVSSDEEDVIKHICSLKNCDNIDGITSAKSKFVEDSLAQRLSETILPQVLYNMKDSSTNIEAIARNEIGKNGLWEMSISGDLPIVLVEVLNETDIERVKAYSLCHFLHKISFIEYDLVFLYDGSQQTRDSIEQIVTNNCGKYVIGNKGGVYLIDKNRFNERLLNLLKAVACHIATRSLIRIKTPLTKFKPITINKITKRIPHMDNPFAIYKGVFANNSFYTTDTPQLPWSHILANETFGTLVSDKSLGFTWALNARENKLTPWSNDTMKDNTGEHIFMETDGEYYDLVRGSCAEFNPKYVHYYGKNKDFETDIHVTVPRNGMIKYVEVEINNISNKEKELNLCYYLEPILNVNRDNVKMLKGDIKDNIILVNNPFNLSGKAYLGVTAYDNIFDFTCDRTSFFSGKLNENILPPIQDMCVAISVNKKLKPKDSCKVLFALCFATSKEGIIKQVNLKPNEEYSSENHLKVNTGDRTIDELVNTWLPHQIVSSRIFGRTGFYQCGGAYGFRDQLQDALSYLFLSPKLTKTHILRCCASQFEEGDVFHWWHCLPKFGGGKKGVRTRYSDDLVWLPYVVANYIKKTGDKSILDIKVPFLIAPEIPEGQKDIYIDAVYTDKKASVYEHCIRSLHRAYNLGEYNLPKIGSGDWNDGYSKVGIHGKGESVWLAQFIAMTMNIFSEICEIKNDIQLEKEYKEKAIKLLNAVDEHCYEKDHYIRAFYDNGEEMGSYKSDECKVDALTQSFSAIADMPDKRRVITAMETAYNALVDEKYGIIKLFTPAFDVSRQEPGYVKSYPKGVRENGGQYTHASVWFAIAMGIIGDKERFHKLVNILNPIKKYQDEEVAKKYKTEPYAMTADIYTNEYSYARGGWSLYTGAAGWYYQLLVEYVLGIKLQNGEILIKPNLPNHIKSYHLDLKYKEKDLSIDVKSNN